MLKVCSVHVILFWGLSTLFTPVDGCLPACRSEVAAAFHFCIFTERSNASHSVAFLQYTGWFSDQSMLCHPQRTMTVQMLIQIKSDQLASTLVALCLWAYQRHKRFWRKPLLITRVHQIMAVYYVTVLGRQPYLCSFLFTLSAHQWGRAEISSGRASRIFYTA